MYNDKNDANSFWKAVIANTFENNYTGKNPLILSKYFEDGGEIPRPENTNFMKRHLGEIKFQKADCRASLEGIKKDFTQ